MELMQTIDRLKVRNAFGKQAHEYDAHAAIQKRVIVRFLQILKNERLTPKRLLDVGAGTGMLLRSLRKIYLDALLVGIDLAPGMCRIAQKNLEMDGNVHILTGDAERLPFDPEIFDLVISTSVFQWLPTLEVAFGEAFRVLVPGGEFCFTLFGEGTLHELRSSYCWALNVFGSSMQNRTHTFFSGEDVAAALERVGFKDACVISGQDVEIYDDVPALLRSLKRIGAGTASPVNQRGLAGKRIMAEMIGRYRKEFGSSSGIPATYGVIYGMGEKPF